VSRHGQEELRDLNQVPEMIRSRLSSDPSLTCSRAAESESRIEEKGILTKYRKKGVLQIGTKDRHGCLNDPLEVEKSVLFSC
jgi:hypothetical protein